MIGTAHMPSALNKHFASVALAKNNAYWMIAMMLHLMIDI
jgi:hypothetical protein